MAQQPPKTDHCPFLDLPAELRNRIYELAVVDTPRILSTRIGTRQPPITKTCRQIRKECLPIFYALNKFQLFWQHTGLRGRHLRSGSNYWIKEIGYDNLRHITSLRLDFDDYYLKFRQNVDQKILELEAGSGLWEYGGSSEPVLHSICGDGTDGFDDLPRLLRDVIDREIEPGLSYRGIRDIRDYFIRQKYGD